MQGWRGSAVAGFGAVLLLALTASAAAAERPSFGAGGTLEPRFGWSARDYVLRGCESADAPDLAIRGAKGWRVAVGDSRPRGGDFSAPGPSAGGESLTVGFHKRGRDSVRRYHLRCLPEGFPTWRLESERKAGSGLFSIQLSDRYGAIFDHNGVPVWWVRAKGEPNNISVLPDGTMTWSPVDNQADQVGPLEVRTIRNKLLHRFEGAPGTVADVHELLLLPNGNYTIGSQVVYEDDATAFGGSADSEVIGIEIQEYKPNGKLVWRWASRDHIGLEETGRWWDLAFLDAEPYDVVHWNAVEQDGRYILISMRHTDAVYKIDKRTGEIVWKLGGTQTPESLEIRGDPLGDYPLGAQHDIRLEDDGTITIFDNRTLLPEPPRAVRYRIDEDAGTAKLVESVGDPDVVSSFCCGSARKLESGEWLVGWGGSAGGNALYDELGRLIFRLTLDVGFTYRAIPVPEGAVSRKELRKAMDAMADGVA